MNGSERPLRVVVAGSGFGRVYLAALARPGCGYTLAGLLARGSERSVRCAARYRVPLWRSVEDVPRDVDLACVAVPNGVGGGRGAQLAAQLLERRVPVLQEHPIHPSELAECLRTASATGTGYRLTTFYPHLEPVRRFVAAAGRLLRDQAAVEIEASCAVHVSYDMIDILGRVLGGLRPWSIDVDHPAPSADGMLPPARRVRATLAGVPVLLRVANHLDPADPDDAQHILHRITLVTEGGTLTLQSTHGPVLWSPCAPAPRGEDGELCFDDPAAVEAPSVVPIGPATAPGHARVHRDVWPAGVLAAVDELRADIRAGADPLRAGQTQLTVGAVWQRLTSDLGYPRIVRRRPFRDVGADELERAAGGAR